MDFKGRLESAQRNIKELLQKHFGIRFKKWIVQDKKMIKDDVIQNVMLLANGILAIVFAIEWNSDNNPLLVIHNKFKSGLTISIDIFETNQVAHFAGSYTYLLFYFIASLI